MKTKNGLKKTLAVFMAVLMLLASAPLAGLASTDLGALLAPRAKASSEGAYCDVFPNGERFDVSYDENTPHKTYRLTPEVSGIYTVSVFPNGGDRYCIRHLVEEDGDWYDAGQSVDCPYDCYLEKGNSYYFRFYGYDGYAEDDSLDAEASVVYAEHSITSVHDTSDIKSISFEQGYDLIAGFDTSDNDILKAVVARVEFNDGEIFDYYFGYEYDYNYYGSNCLRETYNNLAGTSGFSGYSDEESIAGYTGDLSKPGKINVDLLTEGFSSALENVELKNTSLEMNVVENPVESIEYTDEDIEINVRSAESKTIYIYDQELDEEKEVTFDAFECYDRQYAIKINYTDGTSKILGNGSGSAFDGYEIEWFIGQPPASYLKKHLNRRHALTFSTTQITEPWTLGNTYPVTVEYMGKSTVYNVKIVDNPTVVAENERNDFCLNGGETATFTFTPSESGAYNIYDYWKEADEDYELTCKDKDGNAVSLKSFLLENSGDEYIEGFALRKNETYTFEFKNNQEEKIDSYIYPRLIPTACVHMNVTEAEATEATCAKPGYTAGKFCSDCGKWIEGHEKITVPHTDENSDGICDVCGKSTEPSISVGETVTVDVEAGQTVYLRFVPQKDGTYIFTSNAEADTYGHLFDSEKNEIASDDDGAEDGNGNFRLKYQLTAGTVYYWGARYYSSENSGSFDVSLSMQCLHENTEERAATAETCTENGYTEGVICLDCGAWVSGHETVWAHHVDENGDDVCDVCGLAVEPITGALYDSKGNTVGTYILRIDGTVSFSGTGEVYELEEKDGMDGFEVKKIIVGEGITSLGDFRFSGSEELEAVILPGTFERIESGMFSSCSALKELVLADGIKTIGSNAFAGCTALKSVTIPGSVTEIKNGAFSYCSLLESVKISSGVAKIGEEAFTACPALKSVTVPRSVKSIGDYAFGYLEVGKLTDFVVKGFAGTAAEDYASEFCFDFEIACTQDRSGYENRDGVAATCTKNGYTAGVYCPECDLWIEGHEAVWSHHTDENGDNVCDACGFESQPVTGKIYNNVDCVSGSYSLRLNGEMTVTGYGDETVLYFDDENVKSRIRKLIIGDGISRVGGDSFSGCRNLESVVLSDSVKEIRNYAFSGCTALESITIPDSVTYIGYNAFYNCQSLKSVSIPNGVTFIGSYAFSGCTSLESIAVPQSITEIEERAFAGCTALKSIALPEGLSSIGYGAFRNCSKLSEISIPETVTYIGPGAFEKTAIANDPNNYENGLLYIGKYLITVNENASGVVEIREGTLRLADDAFEGCAQVTGVVFPASFIGKIYTHMFGKLPSLEKLEVASGNSRYIGRGNCIIETESKTLVLGCNSSTIPSDGSVTTIGDTAFIYCRGIREIVIPEGIENIGSWAFCECTNAETVTLPQSLKKVSDYAFYSCMALKSVTIPAGVEQIGWDSFGYYTPENAQYASESKKLDFVVGGFANTQAQRYAKENGFEFVIGCSHDPSTYTHHEAVAETCTENGYTAGDYCEVCKGWINGHELIKAHHVDEDGDGVCDVCKQDTCLKISAGQTVSPRVSNGETVLIRFVPAVSGSYTFKSTVDSSIGADPYGYIYDPDMNSLAENDDDGGDYNFSITLDLEAGKVYYLGAKFLSNSTDAELPVTVVSNMEHDHIAVTDPAIDATCTEPGKTEGSHCSVCGEVLVEQKDVPATGHTEVIDAAVAATCTEKGKTEGKHCSVCGEVLVEQKDIPANGHTESSWIIDRDSSCTVGGTKHIECTVCHTTLKTEDIPVKAHTYKDTVTAPTCTTDGYTTHTCTVCGESYVDSKVPANGHTEVIDAAVAATCTEKGRTEGKHCSVCGEVLVEQKDIPANGHTESSWIIDRDSSCTVGGTKHIECTVCHTTLKTEDIPVKAHTYKDTVTAPTCTTDGYTTHTCTVCGESYVDSKVPANGHTEVIDAAVAATCTEKGKTEGKHCSVCGEVLVEQKDVPATGHKYKTTTKKATTSKNGKAVTACTVCGKVKKTTVIYKASSVKLSKTAYTYNGKVQKPKVVIKNGKGKVLTEGKDYTVKYPKGMKKPGSYTVTVTFKGNYSGKKTLTFTIAPKAPTLKVTAAKKAAKLSWSKQTGATGYTVYMATSKNGKYKKVATVKSKVSYTKTGLTKGKTYYFKVAAYTTAGKKAISGAYSAVKSVKAK